VILFIDALRQCRSVKVAIFSIGAAWIQLIGYGTGFLAAAWNRLILKREAFKAFEKKFYD